MAGPSIAVRVLGDMTGISNAFKSAGDKAGEAASKAHDAFSGMLDTINKTGVLGPFGEALSGIDEAIGKVIEHGKSIGPAIMGVGGALVGVGSGLQAIGSKDQAAHQQLQAAVQASGADYDDFAEKIEGAVKSNEKYGDSADKTQDALRILTQATGDPAKALQFLGTATDLAAAKHESLDTAAGQLGKTYNGATKLLKDFGVEASEKTTTAVAKLGSATKEASAADDAASTAKQKLADLQARLAGQGPLTIAQQQQLRDAQQKVVDTTAKATAAHEKLSAAQSDEEKATHGQADTMTALSEKLKGQASAAADTFTGKMSAIKAKVEDAAAAFGQKYGPAITAFGAVMTGAGAAMQVFTGIKEALTTATEAGTVADDAAAVAEGLTLGPILLIVAAVAILGVAIYELWTHWSTVWGFIKGLAMDVWDWISSNWPLLLGILLGPVALAAALIYKYWDQIKAGAQDVIDFIKRIWNDLVAFFSGVVASAGRVLSGLWEGIKSAASTATEWIKDRFNDVVSFLTGLPHRISQAVSGLFDGIKDAARSAFDGVAYLWNHTVGALSFNIPSWVPLVGGKGWDVPDIPQLAQGGLMTASGIIYAHAGEVISPAPATATRTGPVVHIQTANFTDQADLDMLLARAAWSARTAKV